MNPFILLIIRYKKFTLLITYVLQVVERHISNVINKNIFVWLFIYLYFIRIKIFYIDHFIEKVVYAIFHIYFFKFVKSYDQNKFSFSLLFVIWYRNKCSFCSIFHTAVLTVVNTAMVINEKASEIWKYFEVLFCRNEICWNCFRRVYSFITRYHWIINNNSFIFSIFTTICNRILNTILLSRITLFRVFTLTLTFIIILLLIQSLFSTIKCTFALAWKLLIVLLIVRIHLFL